MKKGLIILSIFFVLVLSGVTYAACLTSDNWVINVKNPLGGLLPSNPYSCTDTILYTAANNQGCPSTSSCTFNFAMPANCGMRGLYKMSCTASDLCGADVNFYTCAYDDCPNCCTSDTSYVWLGDGNSHNCCGDNDESDYWTANADTDSWCSGGFTACVSNSYYNNGDSNSFVCACGGSAWNIGGEVSPTTCCGDDASEIYETRDEYAATGWWNLASINDLSSDNACCSATNCVYNSVCSNYKDVQTGVGSGADNRMVCHSDGRWLDCDGDANRCGQCFGDEGTNSRFINSGDGNIGEYGSTTDGGGGVTECCGDDAGENYRYYMTNYDADAGTDITDEDRMGSTNTGDKACCNDDDDCVYQGSCYTEGSYIDLNSNGVDDGWCMTSDSYKGYWRDVDDSSANCAIANGVWVMAAESSGFGEYDSGSATECCGDDTGEYITTQGVGPTKCCNNANDCVDLGGSCVSAVAETTANANCLDSNDNDCDGECDYDSTYCSKGDSGCPVAVTNIVVSDASPWDNTAITVSCTSSVAGVNSIGASIDGVGSCSFTGWAGNVASFSCNVGSASCPGSASKTARCSVNGAHSYQSGADQTTGITVQCSDCSTMFAQGTCEAIPTCGWCPECGGAGNRLTNGGDVCVTTGNCPAYACSLGVCEAECDGNVGGCGAASCDTVTCLCNPDVSCNPDTYGDSNCCDDSLGLEPNVDTDNVVGDFAINCVGASCYGISFPFSEVVSVYDDSCCGDDSGEFFNYFNLHVDGCDDVTDITIEECINATDDTSDNLCCNVAGDCVYNSQCLPAGTGPLDLDGDGVQGEYCSNSGTGTWLDCDVSQISCESPSCGSRTWTNANWETPFGEYENIVDVECCGDDFGEFNRYRQVQSISDGAGAINVVTDLTDIACCPSADACVFNGVCYMDIDVAVAEINNICAGLTIGDCQTTDNCQWHLDNECRVKEWAHNGKPNLINTTYKDKIFKDINQDGNLEVCDPGEWIDPNTDPELCEAMGGYWLGTACCGDIDPDPDCDGRFYGNVKDIDSVNVENAKIDLIGTSYMFLGSSLNYSTTTDAFGDYNVDVTGNGTYDLIATKSGFNPETIINQFVGMSLSKEVNFTLVSSYELCEADCTFVDDEFCHASCDGRVGCQFYTAETKSVCNAVMLGWSIMYNVSHEVICCEGQPYKNEVLKVVSVELDDDVKTMIRLVRLVVLRGKPTRFIIDAFK